MGLDRRTVLIVGTSTVLGFIGDVITYSMAESDSKGESFSLHMPTGLPLFNLVWTGIAYGFIFDFALRLVERADMSTEEKKLADLAEVEMEKIRNGFRRGQTPTQITWKLIV